MSRSPRLASIALLTALVLATGTSMIPPAARAESTKRTAVVGVLGISATTAGTARNFDALRQSLRDGGWVEGDTLRLEVRYSEGRSERFPELAGELVRRKGEVIVAVGSQATKAAMEATATIPIVFVVAGPNELRFGRKACATRRPRDWRDQSGQRSVLKDLPVGARGRSPSPPRRNPVEPRRPRVGVGLRTRTGTLCESRHKGY